MALTDEKILKLYEEWDPVAVPLGDFLDSVSISRSGLYGMLRRYKVTPKSRRVDGDPNPDRALLLDIQQRLARIEALIGHPREKN